jgi:hypothetical protein
LYEDVILKFEVRSVAADEIGQWGSAYASALGAVFAQRDGNFLGSRY